MSDTAEDVGVGSSQSHNHNPSGRNQHKNCPSKNDPRVKELLLEYSRRKFTSANTISELLLTEHHITMSPVTIKRRKKDFGIRGSGATTKQLSDSEKRRLILTEMAKYPNRTRGPRTIKDDIANSTGVHITREWIAQEMRRLDPEGFTLRHPARKQIPIPPSDPI